MRAAAVEIAGVGLLGGLAAVRAKELGEPAAEERAEGGHGARDDGEVDLDGRPHVGDVVVHRLLTEIEEAVDVDQPDDGDDGNTGNNVLVECHR